MLRRINLKLTRLLRLPLLALLAALPLTWGIELTLPQSTSAHEVELSNQVGGTLHLEPNDNPKAGTASLAWIALTRRGGQPIPLTDCNCKLSVYAQPYDSGDTPIQQPTLSATTAESRSGIPSASITFPRAGSYELVLQGSSVTSGSFAPFELRFTVTVAQ